MLETLRRLTTEERLDITLRYFEMRLLGYLGYQPQTKECVLCSANADAGGERLERRGGWRAVSGVCPQSTDVTITDGQRLKLMRLLQRGDFAAVAKVHTAPPLEAELERHLREYILYVLERDVRSTRFLETLRRTRQSTPVP